MKKTISIALIFSFIAPFWIFYSIIQYEKYTTKKEIKKLIIAGLDKNDLVLLRFSNKEIKTKLDWEHSKEFEYLGIMYDVVESETRGDSTYYWCWEDSEETELNNMLNKLITNALGTNKNINNNLKRLSNFFSSLFYSNKNPFYLNGNNRFGLTAALYLNNYSSLTTEPLLPPPKSFSS